MKQKLFRKFLSSLLIAALLVLTVPALVFQPSEASAFIFTLPKGKFIPFGGNIVEKKVRVCLRSLPFFPYILPIPFYVFLVYRPSPAGLYWLFGISQLYEEYEFEKSANSLGNYLVGADELWREFCDINGWSLPTTISGTTWTGLSFAMPITGVAWKMGTSCRVDPKYISDACHQKVLKRTAGQIAEYLALAALGRAAVSQAQSLAQAQFNNSHEDFGNYCDPYSPNGQCYPKNTCDPTNSENAGTCLDSSGSPPE